MLHYPKMPGSRDAPPGRCVAFDKVDGTNLHFAWDRDFGWHALGTRRDRFDLTPDGVAAFAAAHPGLEAAAGVFADTLADGLGRVFREHPAYVAYPELTAFAEFAGPNSFAGGHAAADPKRLVLFDVLAAGYGFVGPRAFAADFGHLPTPQVVYEGKLTGTFMEAVREGKYGVAEGVVCKGGTGGADVWMVKVKTYAYLGRLRQAFGDRWREFGE